MQSFNHIFRHHNRSWHSLLLLLFACISFTGCGVQSTPRVVTATPTLVLSEPVVTLTPIPTRPAGDILAQITRGPDNTFLATHTPIPTVTQSPTVDITNTPTQTIEPTETLDPTITPSPTVTETPLPTNTPTPTATPQLPDLPEVLQSPSISQTIRVPILMYHYVSEPPEDADKYRINLSVEPDRFRAQMQWLKDRGYESVDLYDVIEVLANSGEPLEKVVVITFDDAYIDNYEIAYPILEEFGYKGTFFVPTEFIDFGYEGYMTWEMIEEMAAAGHRFESHTKSHPDLSILKRNDHVWQILGSQETLAAHIGYKPRFLAYPSGRYSDLTLEMVETLSLWGALTTQGGTWRGFHDRYEWKRTRVSYGTTLKDFEVVFRE